MGSIIPASGPTSLAGAGGATGVAGAAPPTLLMGIINVTPDSFSDGGAWFDPAEAVAHGYALVRDGAAILDVGGESTRPGAQRPDVEEELRRCIPVVRELSAQGFVVSIDTMRAPVAAAAVEAGAQLVNDVSGGLADPDMASVVAGAGVDFVAMHWRGHSVDMQDRAVYGDVVQEVCAELQARVEALVAGGIAPERIILDPGLGFAKTAAHNWALLAHLDRLAELGHRLLIGASRKAFLGLLEADGDGVSAPPAARDGASAALSLVCAQARVWGVRVHDVGASRSAVRVAEALAAARAGETDRADLAAQPDGRPEVGDAR